MKHSAIAMAALLLIGILTGCRSKGNDNATPSTTTAPTTTAATMPTTIPTETAAADPTIPSGNGPMDSSTDATRGAEAEAETDQGTTSEDTTGMGTARGIGSPGMGMNGTGTVR